MNTIHHEDGSITTTQSLSEFFMDKEVYYSSTDEQKKEFEKDFVNQLSSSMLCNPNIRFLDIKE